MRRFRVVAGFALGAAVAFAGCATGDVDSDHPSIYDSELGARLSKPSHDAPDVVVKSFLRARGLGAEAAAGLKVVDSQRSARSGLTHVRLEQEIGGLRIEGAYVKAALTDDGELAHVIDTSAHLTRSTVAAARIDAGQALSTALAALHPTLRFAPSETARQGNVVSYARGTFFHAEPTVERVAVAADGAATEAFLVQTWTQRTNQLHYVLVSGEGAVLDIESRTSSDSYRVFTENPIAGGQTTVNGPGGWLFSGAQTSHNIAGNNVHAYLDTNADNAADPGGTQVTNGNFLTAWAGSESPTTAGNQDVAVQNLFYFNNLLHDTLYAHGFTEAAGNFQEDNFGKGGRGGDSVAAEAQDGSGTDNANFATPRDGSNPRMQMYLWTGKGDVTLAVDAPGSVAGSYRAQGAGFGPAFTAGGVTGDVVLVNDGTGTTSDGCEAITADLSNKIALVDRGTCSFVVKVTNAQAAHAVAVIVANNTGTESIFAMGGDTTTVTIPSAMISHDDSVTLKAVSGVHATARLTTPAPLQLDGDLDSDIVFHEYGHGLTWRMIGRMSGAMSGAIGEGMSDVLAVILNGDDIVGEYAMDDPLGIRTAPYHDFPRTYVSVTGSEVHYDGEIYGAIGWRLYELFGAARKSLLLDYIVEGMNFTPAGPKFEDMRDGILAAVSDPADKCLVWRAFAKYGVGKGAKATVKGSTIKVTESFDTNGCGAL